MKTIFKAYLILGMFALMALATSIASAQDEVPPPMPGYQSLSGAQLDQLIGPIALYPDPLISEILPAATFPTEIVMADRYLTSGGDPNAIDQQPWDPSVQALAHYPQVLSWMDNNLNWTTQLGQAFENQQQDVMDSVQRLRTQAYNLGNLQSTPQQQVVDDGGDIEILPANSDNVYVPEYQPDQVYYDQPYGAPFITFSTGYIIGPWLYCDFDWHNHNLVFWDRDHPRPNSWWHGRPDWHASGFAAHTTTWNPAVHSTGRVSFQGGDRGYSNPDTRAWTAPQGRTAPAPIENRAPAMQAPSRAPEVNYQRPPDNAFIGGDNARDARAFDQRGQESTRSFSAPAVHESSGSGGGSHPSVAPSGGGGGFHSGGGGGGRH